MKKGLFVTSLVVFAIALFFTAAPAKADTLYLQGVNYPDDIFATVEFNYVGNSLIYGMGVVEITVANTSLVPAALTAIAFNVPSNITGLASFSGPDGWSAVYEPNGVNTPGNFGYFDTSDITGPSFNGGKPLNGIWTGESTVLEIAFFGTGMDSLTTADFLGIESFVTNSGTPTEFIARFQAIGCEGGSDVAIPSSVPVPGALWLLGPGLAGLAFFRKRVSGN
jgi:hypothetical protein